MEILFTADWHIKLGQKNVPRTWAQARYGEFFQQIYKLETDVDLHIIGGDIFDRVPSMEELALYFQFVSECKIPTVIYDGNHEATKKGSTFLTQLKKATQKINPLVNIIDESIEEKEYSILPYCQLHKKDSIEMFDSSKPLFTHVRGDIPPHVHAEVDLSRFDSFPYVFAGDLHAHSNCQLNIVYPGSPMTIAFHRNKVTTGYLIIDTEKSNEWYWGEFHLPQLIRKTIQNPEHMIPGIYDHVIYEIEGDLSSLANVKDSSLLDKKIVKRQSDTALILHPEMTLLEELHEYLAYILELPDATIESIIRTFNDNS